MRLRPNLIVKATNPVVDSAVMHSHAVTRVRLASDPSTTYILKTETDPIKARTETLTQEFFRLIIPHQPQTFLINDNTQQRYLILSEESIGYTPLSANGTYTGLGQALACALFLEEADLKNGNIGVDNQNRIIKIDGDHGLAELMKDALLFALTAECIANPLKPPHFAAYNWIGYIRNGKLSAAGDGFFRPNLHQQAEFRAEFNQGLLRIINLSNEHIQALVLEYFHDETAQKAYQLLCSRRDTLKTLLEQDDSFRLYKQSAEARADQQHFKAHLEQFATNGVLLSSCVENIPLTQLKQDGLKLISRVKQHRVNRNDSAAQQKLQALSIAINSSESLKELETIKKQLTLDLQASLPDKVIAGKDCCFNLIREIKRYSVNNSDTALKTYLEGIEDQCQAARTIKQLAEIQTSLNDKLSTVKLEEVLAYKQTCLQLISEIQAYDNQHALSEDLDGMYTKIQQSHETKELKTIQNELTVQLIELEYNSAYARCLALFVDVHILHDAEDTPLHNVIEQIDQELPVVGTIQRLAAIEAQLTNILATIHSEKFIAAKQQLNNDNSDDAPNKHPT